MTTTPQNPDRRATRLLRRRWAWIALTTVLVVAGALLFSLLQRPSYQSSVDVVVLAELNSPTSTPSTPSMGTEKALATSALILVPAAQRIGAPPADVFAGVTVTVPAQTDTLEISCAMSDPVLAARCAQAVGEGYVQYKDRQPYRTAPEAGRVVTGPAIPTTPVSPNIPLNLAAGLVVGLALGLVLAPLRDLLDDHIREIADVERHGPTVLGVVPPWRRTGRSEAADRRGTLAYATLAAKVRHVVADTVAPVVAVTSVGTKSPGIAGDLAVALAAGGDRVVLVHADTRGAVPPVPGDAPGLFDVLAGRTPAAEVLRPTTTPGLTELRLGGKPAGAGISRRAWTDTIAALAPRCDVVVVAAAPLLATEDGLAITGGATAVLAAVDDRHCLRSDVDRFVDEADQLGLTVIGAALVAHGLMRPGLGGAPVVPGPREPSAAERAPSAAPAAPEPATAEPDADPRAGSVRLVSLRGRAARPSPTTDAAEPPVPSGPA